MLTHRVLMVRPAAFGFSVEAAATNVFQRALPGDLQARAAEEFDGAVATLRAAGVDVTVVQDTPSPPKPDAVFPNNWFSTHPDGTAVLYPMAVPSRRAERRPDVVRALPGVVRVVDLSGLEAEGAFLEGTGSLVLDHDRKLAFACLSPRTTERGLQAFAAATGYRPVVFSAVLDGAPVYHTNVVMALGPRAALVGWEVITEGADAVRDALGDRDVVALSAAQLRAYAGNALWVTTTAGPRVIMSRSAWDVLPPADRARLDPPIVLDIPTIETVGGGSARCMVAELFPD